MTTVSDLSSAPPRNPTDAPNLTDAPNCEACGRPLEARTRRGRPRRYCNEACRSAGRRRASGQAKSSAAAPGARAAGPPGAGALEAGRADPALAPGLPRAGDSAAESEPGDNRSWYYAKFASPGDEPAGHGRRRIRYKLRQLLREITSVERCRRCGREVLGGAVMVKVKDGVAHVSGVETCGRLWLCPVCAAKIRARRGDEIAEGVGRWIAKGGGAYFVTATLPHDQGDALARSLDVLTSSWRALTAGKAYQTEKERFGLVGNIKAIEVTHGRNGWHPHVHAVFLTRSEIGVLDLCDWYGRLDARWARALVRNGWSPGQQPYRLRLDLVNRSTAAGLAAYVTKVQDAGLGNEIARADLKRGRASARTPMQILADFGTWGLAEDLDLWLEYEQATAGKSALRWSRGLRSLLLPDVEEQTDEEIAAEEVGGDEIAALLPHIWYRIAEIPGAEAAVLEAVEADGWEGLLRVLVGYRISTDGVLTPEEWASHGGWSA